MKPSVLSLVLSLSAIGSAQEKPNAAGPPTPPSPLEVKKTVTAVVGQWVGEMVATAPKEQPERFKFSVDCKPVALGAGATCVQSGKASIGRMEESCLIAYDPDGKSVHKMCVGSMGEVHDHRGRWKDAKTIEFEPLKGTMGGKPIVETVTMSFPDAKTLTNKSVVQLSDGSAMTFEFSGKRK